MINLFFPMAASSKYFKDSELGFMPQLLEIQGKLLIEHVINNYAQIQAAQQFLFVINAKDNETSQIESILKLLTQQNSKIIKVNGRTKGSACSSLLTMEYINNDQPLIIANSDQFFATSLAPVINYFTENKADAGVITFETVHPRWSFVKFDSTGKAVEAAEKKPISKNAIAGFYYFAKGSDYVKACMRMIKKNAHINGNFFISPCLNELILEGKTILGYNIPNDMYHTFYSPQKVEEFYSFKKRLGA